MNLREDIFYKYNGKCGYCGCIIYKDTFCIDHMTPRWQGGKANRSNMNNMMPTCHTCNATKTIMDLEEFRKFLSILPKILGDISGIKVYNKFYGKLKKPKDIIFYYETIGEQSGKK